MLVNLYKYEKNSVNINIFENFFSYMQLDVIIKMSVYNVITV